MAPLFSELRPSGKIALCVIIVVVGIAAWLVIASSIFIGGTGLWKHQHHLPFLEIYRYWQAYPNDLRVLKWCRNGAVGATFAVALMGIAIVLRGTKQALHGETGFASNGELQGRFRGRKETILCGRRGGYLCYSGEQHVGLYAPTGSGKGVSIVIPNALMWDGSLVVFDPKKELYHVTAGIRAFCRQEVHLFDPLDQESRTARYNPFSYVKRGTEAAFDDIQRIGQVLFPGVASDEDFWRSAARSAFNGVAGLLAESPDLPFTLGEVFRILTRADGPTYLQQRVAAARLAGRPNSQAVVSALSDYLNGSENLVNSIRKSATARLELWNNPLIDKATAASDFDLRDLRKRLMAVYVGVSPDNVERLRPLLTLFFQQLLDVTAQQGEPKYNALLRRKLLVLFDEFPILGKMEKVAEAFSWVRSYGLRFLVVIQSKAQLRYIYGPDLARTMMENCGVEIVFGTDDLDLSREISERLGYNTVSAVSRSRGMSLFSQNNRDSKTISDQRRALLLPQEVRTLSDRKSIILSPGVRPILADRIIYHKDKNFTRLVLPAPAVKPIAAPEALPGPAPAARVTAEVAETAAETAGLDATRTPAKAASARPRKNQRSAEPPPGDPRDVQAVESRGGNTAAEAGVGASASITGTEAASVNPESNAPRRASKTTSGRIRKGEEAPAPSPDKSQTPAAKPPQKGRRGERSDTIPPATAETLRDVALRVVVENASDREVPRPEPPPIWDSILAAKPDLSRYGLEESKELMSSIVARLPLETQERTMAAADR
jgi:type IV secretion system protein VirD4